VAGNSAPAERTSRPAFFSREKGAKDTKTMNLESLPDEL